jgi:hypothetical protein
MNINAGPPAVREKNPGTVSRPDVIGAIGEFQFQE